MDHETHVGNSPRYDGNADLPSLLRAGSHSPSAPSPEVAKKLQELLDGFVSQPHVVNYVALVDGGSSRWRWAGAAGIANPQTNDKMTVQHQFRIASVTKTFTAVVILQLMEEGRLSLDTTLATLMNGELPGGYAVNDLHSVKEKLGDTITVRQRLSHTSGLPDYFGEPATGGDHPGMGLGDALDQELLKPGGKGATKQWSPTDIITDYFDRSQRDGLHPSPFLNSGTDNESVKRHCGVHPVDADANARLLPGFPQRFRQSTWDQNR